MNINIKIKATNIELTDAIKNYVNDKIEMLKKMIDLEGDVEPIAEVEVGTVTRGQQSGDIFRAEINLEISGKFYRAESEMDDLYAAIDDIKDEMMRILRRDKNKNRDLFRRGAGKIKDMVRGFYRGKK